ncbi:hypothetical protein [Methylobacterium isbiliense]|uniref:Type II toxin-antitoxin system HicA family toxin n=1 Tax=Methylobacterium isbiliense TaxID=315478 RepID=A0ABQ4SNY9_9HYPH|nr:hypothetical protein [Methylobacterium isbiliense]MDN3627152.1 hypothetical protein [Methylobacterium isbiliense]GJE03593.1 hypothetical protein GMJLKIPL_5550 [Methylobacterium isbiliense]
MTRDQLIRSLRTYARKRALPFDEDRKKGKGSHYRVRVGGKVTTIQSELNPNRIARILKQLGVDPADL